MSTNFLHKLLNDLPEESRWITNSGLKYVPQARIYQLLLQLEQDIMRKVLVKRGKDSEDYKFFADIKDALYQAGEAEHLTQTLKNELQGFKEYNQFLHARNAALEVELNRYRTIEELSRQSILEAYIDRVRELIKPEIHKNNT